MKRLLNYFVTITNHSLVSGLILLFLAGLGVVGYATGLLRDVGNALHSFLFYEIQLPLWLYILPLILVSVLTLLCMKRFNNRKDDFLAEGYEPEPINESVATNFTPNDVQSIILKKLLEIYPRAIPLAHLAHYAAVPRAVLDSLVEQMEDAGVIRIQMNIDNEPRCKFTSVGRDYALGLEL